MDRAVSARRADTVIRAPRALLRVVIAPQRL